MNSQIKNILYQIAGILILLAAAGYFTYPRLAAWVMIGASALFTGITASMPYQGESVRVRRLFFFQLFSCFSMLGAAYLMWHQDNNWLLAMIVAAIFMLYSSIMLPRQLKKEKEDQTKV